VIYFDPADRDFPAGLNLLHGHEPEDRHLVASGIVGAFKGIWRDSWGPRTEYILYAAIAALLETETETLLGLPRLLTDDRYRAWVLRQCRDVAVRSFWLREFESYDKRFRAEIVAPLQNKAGQLLMSPLLRNVLGQVRSSIDPAFAMNNGRIFIANLSKGRLGAGKSDLLGALLVSAFSHAAMARASLPDEARRDFHLYVDEFQNFGTDAFASILSEARKYRLSLTLAHQYTAQLDEVVRDAVFGNVGTLLAFRVGASDGEILHREFGRGYTPEHFTGLAQHEVCVKASTKGSHREPFTGRTLPPVPIRHGYGDVLIRRSRERYGSGRLGVEQKIRRWSERRF
jgi:hypothetical protein